ncbi:hypothetical protein FDP41_005066 [Naegleria fowleri]|uniref:Uncharacterized protein n=1 Tax=Naegleria fowleri TaxID=5763 RepID=A0A6A5BS51_NAEFO|nr:uncharacterized protein FDP41_005066 [Naegleria fowleri]KAF0975739.1 hypothetical protein FDP41_005066 [Naegleria fowleri]
MFSNSNMISEDHHKRSESHHDNSLSNLQEYMKENNNNETNPSSISSHPSTTPLSTTTTPSIMTQHYFLENAKPSLVSLFSASSTVCACKGVNPVTNSQNVSTFHNESTTCTIQESSIVSSKSSEMPFSSSLTSLSSTILKTTPSVTYRLNDEFDEIDLFESIADIRDPEHPYSLEELNIVNEHSIVFDSNNIVKIYFTPTVKHCSLVSHISLCIRERLKNRYGKHTFTTKYKLEIYVTEGSHNEEEQVNKQMNDKERVTAALENPLIMELVRQCIKEE